VERQDGCGGGAGRRDELDRRQGALDDVGPALDDLRVDALTPARVVAGRIVVVGLGPAGPELVTQGTLDRLKGARRVVLRTTRHPAAIVAAGASSFDDVYEREPTLDDVYRTIVMRLVEMASDVSDGELVYAVPGSPVVAERTVELLVERAAGAGQIDVEVVPALSFLDLAWVRLGIDPVARGVRVVDGQRFEVDAAGQRGPLLVAQCDSVHVLSEVKLALDAGDVPALAPTSPVTVLHHLGLDDELVAEVPWEDLDRVVVPDHLTSLYLPHLAAPIGAEVQRFVELVDTLRRECPWDRKQTHTSLRRHLLEESYEVLEAIDELDVESGRGYDHLEEELGDLLFQVAFHSRLAAEEGRFTMADVARTVHDKLVSRHPHVFGDVEVADADEVVTNWEQIKKQEKGRESVFDGIPAAMPALLYALKIQKKAATLELGIEDADVVEPTADGSGHLTAEELGELLWGLVDQARVLGLDPEDALRAAAVRERDRLRALERFD
jgi:tetrapyrrole methylase family protein/MazG family protein